MPRFGIHAMVWVGGWSNAEAERAITAAARTGYDILEIPLLDPNAIDLAHTRMLLDREKITGNVSLGLSPDADVSSTDRSSAPAKPSRWRRPRSPWPTRSAPATRFSRA